jgi:hypothetical protein
MSEPAKPQLGSRDLSFGKEKTQSNLRFPVVN